jgi:MFS family permease
MTGGTQLGRRSVVVSTLGITQTLAWGSTYYLPAVFDDPMADALHLSRPWFFGIFSAALLLSGLLGPLAGRMIDRYGGRDVLAITSLIFAAGLALLAFASGTFSLAVAWIVLGIGMGFGLYEAAFATVTGLYGRDARNAITGITLFAGFASTVGWPASAFFIHAFGWRGAALAWAALHLLIGLPMNRLLVPKATPHAPVTEAVDDAPRAVPWTMIVLAGVFGATWFVATAFAAHLPRLLEALGATPAAAVFAGSLVGPAQVAADRVQRFAPSTADALGAAGDDPPSDRSCIARCDRTGGGCPLRAAVWRRKWPSDHCARHTAVSLVRPRRLRLADRNSRCARAHTPGCRTVAVWAHPGSARPARRPPPLRFAHGLVVHGTHDAAA